MKKETAKQAVKTNNKPIFGNLIGDIRSLIETARHNVAVTVNTRLTILYWQIGIRIRQDILNEKRAGYGELILPTLSAKLVPEFGNGFGIRNLSRMIRFAEVFPEGKILSTLLRELSWSHFVEIIPLKDGLQRDFYAEMCRIERWSVRTLRKKIDGMLYERTAISKKPEELVKKELSALREEDRLTPDLLFFHRKLKRLIAIELKLGKFKAAHKGQMELYLRWLEKYEKERGEETPLGLILCAGKTSEQIELLQLDNSGIKVAEYMTELPKRELLEQKLHKAVELARKRLEAKSA